MKIPTVALLLFVGVASRMAEAFSIPSLILGGNIDQLLPYAGPAIQTAESNVVSTTGSYLDALSWTSDPVLATSWNVLPANVDMYLTDLTSLAAASAHTNPDDYLNTLGHTFASSSTFLSDATSTTTTTTAAAAASATATAKPAVVTAPAVVNAAAATPAVKAATPAVVNAAAAATTTPPATVATAAAPAVKAAAATPAVVAAAPAVKATAPAVVAAAPAAVAAPVVKAAAAPAVVAAAAPVVKAAAAPAAVAAAPVVKAAAAPVVTAAAVKTAAAAPAAVAAAAPAVKAAAVPAVTAAVAPAVKAVAVAAPAAAMAAAPAVKAAAPAAAAGFPAFVQKVMDHDVAPRSFDISHPEQLSIADFAETTVNAIQRVGHGVYTVLDQTAHEPTVAWLGAKAQTAVGTLVDSATHAAMVKVSQLGNDISHMEVQQVIKTLVQLFITVVNILYTIINAIITVSTGQTTSEWAIAAGHALEKESGVLLAQATSMASDISHTSLIELANRVDHLSSDIVNLVAQSIGSSGTVIANVNGIF